MALHLNNQKPSLPRENQSNVRRSSTAVRNLFFALTILFLAVAGCKDPNAIEKARQSGELAGKIDGQRTGDTEGYQSAYQPAKDNAYKTTINDLYRSNKYKRRGTYIAIIVGSAFLLGFGLQYLILYGLRTYELLFDIDRIVLPKRDTQVNFKNVLVTKMPAAALQPKQPDVFSSDSTHD